MDTLHIAVCDNHVSSLTFITSEITKQIMNMNVQADVASFSSGEDVMCRVSEGMFFDLYILNIEMPKLDGITLALQIRRHQKNPVIIFVSAREEYVFDSFKAHPYSFVRKDHFHEDLSSTLKAFMLEYHKREDSFLYILRTPDALHKLNLRQILYIRDIRDGFIELLKNDGTAKRIRYNINDLEKELEPCDFVRIHPPLFFSAAEHKIAKKQQPEDKENRHKDIRHKKCDRHTKCDPEHGIAYDPFHWISPNLFITRICICKGIVAQKVMDFTELSDPHDLLLSFSLFFFFFCL